MRTYPGGQRAWHLDTTVIVAVLPVKIVVARLDKSPALDAIRSRHVSAFPYAYVICQKGAAVGH
jgi:hypothetical protein